MESLTQAPNITLCSIISFASLFSLTMFAVLNRWFYWIFMIKWVELPPVYKHSFYYLTASFEAVMIWVFWQSWVGAHLYCPFLQPADALQ